MHGDVEEGPAIWDGLQDAIQGVEGQTRKWRQAVLLVVLVVNEMEPPVHSPSVCNLEEQKLQQLWTCRASKAAMARGLLAVLLLLQT